MMRSARVRRHVIPCCYEMQLDLERVACRVGLPPEEVIRLHAATEYTVYAVGFSPGFPYLGYLPDAAAVYRGWRRRASASRRGPSG